MKKEFTVNMNKWEKFYEFQVEGLDCDDHFDQGFRVAMSIANDWMYERMMEQRENNPAIPRRICHMCEAEMEYTEDYETTFNVKGEYIFIDRIRAHICPNCGEIVYSSEEAKRIEDIVHKRNTLDF